MKNKLKIPTGLLKQLEMNPVVLADAGAAGGIHERWVELKDGLNLVGFEPDKRAFDLLPKRPGHTWINAALGNKNPPVTLLVTRHQTNTSLLQANKQLIERIYKNPADFEVVNQVQVPCTTLDVVSEEERIKVTALKADTQGTELSILKGAEACLRESLLVVELEVEFSQLYAEQPLFSEIDEFMRQHGFMLFDLGNLLYHKWRKSYALGGIKGQLLAADALYFKTPESVLLNLALAKDEPIACLAKYWALCEVYGYQDLAYELSLEMISAGLLSNELTQEIREWEASNRKRESFIRIRGRGRFSNWLRKLADEIDVSHHSRWINTLGN